jgi:hypothetical protein
VAELRLQLEAEHDAAQSAMAEQFRSAQQQVAELRAHIARLSGTATPPPAARDRAISMSRRPGDAPAVAAGVAAAAAAATEGAGASRPQSGGVLPCGVRAGG